MFAYSRGQLIRLLKIDFIRFCIVGGTGFILNLSILIILNQLLHVSVSIAQFIGAEVALFSNFMLHHHWTYVHNTVKKQKHSLLIQFHTVSWPAIVGSTFMVTACEKLLHFNNALALMISSAIALLWNFFWSKYVVWRDVSPSGSEHLV